MPQPVQVGQGMARVLTATPSKSMRSPGRPGDVERRYNILGVALVLACVCGHQSGLDGLASLGTALRLPWRARDPPVDGGARGGKQGDYPAELPLPLAFVVAVSTMLVWEAIHPRASTHRRSSIMYQALGRLSSRAEALGVPHHLDVATSLRRSVSPPTEATGLGRPHQAVGTAEAAAIDAWRVVEARNGPLSSGPLPGGSVVFFADHTLALEAGSTEVTLTLFRVGDVSSKLSVVWSTMDSTAIAGLDYEATQGSAVFGVGEESVLLSVKLLPGDPFYEHRVFIVHVEAIIGSGTMGSLPLARVRLLDAGEWPPRPWQSKEPGAKRLDASGTQKADGHPAHAFVRMLVRWRGGKFWVVVAAMLWKDFHKVVLNAVFLNFLLYDYCITRPNDPAAYRRLPAVVGLKFLFVLLDRVADHVETNYIGIGACTQLVQKQLLHKYLEMQHDPVSLGYFYHLFFNTAPDSIESGYRPVFGFIRSLFTLALSSAVALLMPTLHGSAVSPKELQPLWGIVFLVPAAFLLALAARGHAFRTVVERRRDLHVEVCKSFQELLECRHSMRAFDCAYPAEDARLTFDEAYRTYSAMSSHYSHFRSDTQWVAKYLGEMAKLAALLYGGYAVLDHARTGRGTMTLGQFTLVISLYGMAVGALYDFIAAWDSFSYTDALIGELSDFFSHTGPWLQPLDGRTPSAWVRPCGSWKENLAIKLNAVRVDLHCEEAGVMPRHVSGVPQSAELRGVNTEIPLGSIYALTASDSWNGARRYVGAILGGATVPLWGSIAVPGFARTLLVHSSPSFAPGSVLENLMSYAASWVRGSDVLALAATLGLPFETPPGEVQLHKHCPSRLLNVLSLASKGPRLLRRVEPGDLELLDRVAASFQARMAAQEITVLSPLEEVEPLLRPAQLQVLDLIRGLLADPDVLVVQNMLVSLPSGHARAVLHVLTAWQRLGGLRGLASAWQCLHQLEADPASASGGPGPATYPGWITEVGGLCRTVVLSEPALVNSGLAVGSHIDAWLVVGDDSLDVVAAE